MLYTDIRDVKDSAGHIQMNGRIDLLRDDIIAVENDLIQKYIGQALYDQVHSSKENVVVGTAEYNLLMHLRRYISHKALYRGASKVNVQYTKAGISSEMSDTSKPVREWMLNDVKLQLLNDACEFLDILLKYLQDNSDSLSAWTSSAQYKKNKLYVINDLGTFEKYYNLNQSYSTFYNLEGTISFVDDVIIRKLLGDAYYTALKAEIANANVSADNQVVLDRYLYRITAYSTVIRAAQTMGVLLLNGGIKVNEYTSTVESGKITRNAEYKEREVLIKRLDTDCLHLGDDLRLYLNTNASESKYAEWFSSDLYEAPVVEEDVEEEEEDTTLGFFSM